MKSLGCLSQIQDTPNKHHAIFLNAIVYRVRKALGERPMVPEYLSVNPGIQDQRIDLGEQAVDEIGAKTLTLAIIEYSSTIQVF